MTVKELMKLLQEVDDKDLEVDAEGCDCINPVSGIEIREEKKPYVLITIG